MHPFFRNHNILEGKDQEFFNLGKATQITAKRNIKLRYSLLKFFHSIFLKQKGIGAILYSLYFIYPSDPLCNSEPVVNTQFLWSDILMITPVLHPGVTKIHPYFPEDY
jgi:alpha-glucosidase/lysosomal alpha-glucosidase